MGLQKDNKLSFIVKLICSLSLSLWLSISHAEDLGRYISSEPITKYSLLNLINEHFKLGIEITRDTKIKSNKVLISKKFTEITTINPPNWNDLILEFKEDSSANNALYKN